MKLIAYVIAVVISLCEDIAAMVETNLRRFDHKKGQHDEDPLWGCPICTPILMDKFKTKA